MPFWGFICACVCVCVCVCAGWDGSHVLMCAVCTTESCVSNRFYSDTPPGVLGSPPPPFFLSISRMTSLAGRPAASDEQVRRVPRCDARCARTRTPGTIYLVITYYYCVLPPRWLEGGGGY